MGRRLCLLILAVMLTGCLPGVSSTPTPLPTAPAVTTEQPTEAPRARATPEAGATVPAVSTAVTKEDSSGVVDDLATLAAAEPQQRDQAALVEAFKHTGDLPKVARTTPLDVKVGDVETFWVTDVLKNENYQVQAKLRYAGPVALMYVDMALDADTDQKDIESSAKLFEEKIYPRDREIFGHENSPGVDGDVRLTVLNTDLNGAGGYFSSSDAVTKEVNRFSNQREMFVIGVNSYPLGTKGYASTLAHEFQHMIEWNVAPRSATWFNEGMSMLAQDLNGYPENGSIYSHIGSPDIQLNGWSNDAAQTGDHYGTSNLFFRYIYQQYGGEQAVTELVKNDAGNHLNAFVDLAKQKHADIESFGDLVADWAVASTLGDESIGDGRYGFSSLPDKIVASDALASDETTVSQFGADYLKLPSAATVQFDGSTTVSLTGAAPHSGKSAWWSNRADDSVQTLTRSFDLSSVSSATLNFALWHEIELDYDYAFVAVSTDNGKTWNSLKGNSTTDKDPQGQNFGNGLTGISGAADDAQTDGSVAGKWIDEKMDLTPYAGKQIQLRFWMVGDAAYNAAGMLIDDIRIPEIHYTDDVEAGDNGWEAVGFVRTSGELPQQWELRLIRQGKGGTTVEPVATDAEGRAEIALKQGEQGTLVVLGATPFTTEPASYSYTVQ